MAWQRAHRLASIKARPDRLPFFSPNVLRNTAIWKRKAISTAPRRVEQDGQQEPGTSRNRTPTWSYAALAGASLLFGYSLGSGWIELPYSINYRPEKLPRDDSPEARAYVETLVQKQKALPLLASLDEDPDWTQIDFFAGIKNVDGKYNLIAGVLQGIGRLAVPPTLFFKSKTKELIAVFHIGQDLCGHKGIIHGGFLATMFDECFGRAAIATFPSHTGVTANMNINYRRPTRANQFVAMKAKVIEFSDHKAIVVGRMETVERDPQLLCEAEATFIVPAKYRM